MDKNDFNERCNALRDLIEIQGRDGNWNYDEYMHGLYNGLVVAASVISSSDNSDPYLREAPETWLKINNEQQLRQDNVVLHNAYQEYLIIKRLTLFLFLILRLFI